MGILYKNITLSEEKDLHNIMFNYMKSAEAISFQDISDLTTYFQHYDKFIENVLESIPVKENLAVITYLILNHCQKNQWIKSLVNSLQ